MTSTHLVADHPAYPPRLAALGGKPPDLWVQGFWPPPPGIAVVGARESSEEGKAFAYRLARSLAQRGVAVYSGGALGIDSAAHKGALAGGGFTALFHAGGQNHPSPSSNRDLFREVVRSGGVIVAQLPDRDHALRHHFPLRNRILAAMCTALVVVEAGEKSGARHALGVAQRLGRPVGVVPGAPWAPSGLGCALELARGVAPVVTVDHVLALAGIIAPAPVGVDGTSGEPPRPVDSNEAAAGLPIPALGPVEARVFDALGAVSLHADVIGARAGLTSAELATALLRLSLRRLIVEGPLGSYRRSPPR